jgi:hypothetical protein
MLLQNTITYEDRMDTFKPIPNFTKYEINRDGMVRDKKSQKQVLPKSLVKGGRNPSVNLLSDLGDRTTRTIPGLVELAWRDNNVRN